MKIGLSYSRCLRDIALGIVPISDVLVVISRTSFDPENDDDWRSIWHGYTVGTWSYPEWAEFELRDEARFRDLTIQLVKEGKFHQPRQFGAHPKRLPYHWLEVILPLEELDNNLTVKKAWEQFQIVAGLAGVDIVKNLTG